MFLKRLLTYLNPLTIFRKSDHDFSLKAMHSVNRISIFLFLFCLIVMLIRWLER